MIAERLQSPDTPLDIFNCYSEGQGTPLVNFNKPTLLMSAPLSYSANVANNDWMLKMTSDQRVVSLQKALDQFHDLYRWLAERSLVYLLPTPVGCKLQDLVFTANLGAIPFHLLPDPIVILSNFSSPPRVGETTVGEQFFNSMGYRTYICPFKFEGEAELKHLGGSSYIGGYGIRSEWDAYKWMEEEFGMTIIKVKETDGFLYHLDTMVCPISDYGTLVCTEMFTDSEVRDIEKFTNVIAVTREEALPGICNSLVCGNTILTASHISELKQGDEIYYQEKLKLDRLSNIAADAGMDLKIFNLSEFLKGGALLSCMIMKLA